MSKHSVYKVQKEKQVPIPVIEDDYRAIKKDIKKKMSLLTLKYLHNQGKVKAPYYSIYKMAADRPEDRISVTEKAVIEHINCKLVNYYESI